jgi:hypothetical protein
VVHSLSVIEFKDILKPKSVATTYQTLDPNMNMDRAMTNRTTPKPVSRLRRSSISDPERAKIRERNRIAANKCRQKKKREHE